MKLKGKIRISRPMGNCEPHVRITLTDVLSGSQCVEASMGLAEFAEAVTGHMESECEFEWRPAVVGMQYENKTEVVEYSENYSGRDEQKERASKAIKKLEVDGWKGRLDDALNHHNQSRSGGKIRARVVFTRHVKVQ